jgi:hypothetical protein
MRNPTAIGSSLTSRRARNAASFEIFSSLPVVPATAADTCTNSTNFIRIRNE